MMHVVRWYGARSRSGLLAACPRKKSRPRTRPDPRHPAPRALRALPLILAAALLLPTGASNAEAPPQWTWSRLPKPGRAGDTTSFASGVRVNALAAAPDGAVYVAGTAWGNVDVAPGLLIRLPTQTRVSDGYVEHAFLLRVDRAGKTSWAKRLGHRSTMHPAEAPPGGATALAVDTDGSLIAAGAFTIERRHGRAEPATLARFDPRGELIGAVEAGGPLAPDWGDDGSSHVLSLVVTARGNLFVVGCTRSWDRGGKGLHAGEGRGRGFVGVFSRLGEPGWTYRFAAPFVSSDPADPTAWSGWSACGTSVVPGPGDDLYVGGSYFGAGTLAADVRIPRQGTFLARFSPDGQLRWSRQLGEVAVDVRLARLAEGRVAATTAFEHEHAYRAGLAVFDAKGERSWLLLDGEQPWGLAWDNGHLWVAPKGNRIAFAGTALRSARLGDLAIRRPPACAFAATFTAAGRGGELRSLVGDDCALTAMATGDDLWLAGTMKAANGPAAFVQRVAFPP
jgi:hypothetical protein